ncbi:MAG: hypothetical protein ACOCP8_09780, partial [archaeon]
DISTYTNASWDFDEIWNIDSEVNDGYPYFGAFFTPQEELEEEELEEEESEGECYYITLDSYNSSVKEDAIDDSKSNVDVIDSVDKFYNTKEDCLGMENDDDDDDDDENDFKESTLGFRLKFEMIYRDNKWYYSLRCVHLPSHDCPDNLSPLSKGYYFECQENSELNSGWQAKDIYRKEVKNCDHITWRVKVKTCTDAEGNSTKTLTSDWTEVKISLDSYEHIPCSVEKEKSYQSCTQIPASEEFENLLEEFYNSKIWQDYLEKGGAGFADLKHSNYFPDEPCFSSSTRAAMFDKWYEINYL